MVIQVNSSQATNHFVKYAGTSEPLLLKECIEKLWNSEVCGIFRCKNCGSRFSHPHVAGDEKFYEIVSPHGTYPPSRWEYEITKEVAGQILRDGGCLLEIGGGSGAFVKKMMAQGLSPEKIAVVEFSELATVELTKIGIRVEAVNFHNGVPGAPYKVIVLFQTLEHLDRLDEVLNSLRNAGTDFTHVFISVPNVDYVDWAQENLGLIDMPPNHITAFSAEGLARLFQRNGWSQIEIKYHERDSLIERCKYGAMRGLQYPSNLYQKCLSKIVKASPLRFKKTSLYFCAALVLVQDIRLIRKVPPEDIWLHAVLDPVPMK